MKSSKEIIEVLNDLIKINNDRIEGYEKAIENAKTVDVGLQTIFSKMKSESIKYTAELHNRVLQLGGEPQDGTTVSGKLYRAWMDVKATFTGKDRTSLLEACEYGEDAAQTAYKDALETEGLPADIRDFIAVQKKALRSSHDEIKAMRDMQRAIS
ncbi:PA2169 family four-helix-bundle protein [soil metagenome]